MKFSRRDFIHAGCVAGVVSLAPHFLDRARAGINNPGSAAVSGFNGGKSQIQSSFLESGGDYPFINVVKTAQDWSFVSNNNAADPATLDSNGYPTSIVNGGVATVFFIPTQTERPGNWILSFTSTANGASVGIVGAGTLTAVGTGPQSLTISAATMATLGSLMTLQITVAGVTNLAFYHSSDATAFASGEVFGTRFLQLLRQGKLGVVRFLNWQFGNTSNVTTWALRKPQTYYSYQAGDYGRATKVTTAGSGDAFTATTDGISAPADKQTLILTFDHNAADSGPWSLNLNGTGALPMVDYSGATTPGIGGFATVVFEATLQQWLKIGGATFFSTGIINGVPPELCFQLCKEIGAHPYFVTPFLAIDPLTDYMTSLASYCLANNPGWMVPRFEGVNESWNTAFAGGNYSGNKSNVYWGYKDNGNADWHWHGRAISLLGQAIAGVYGVTLGNVQSQSSYQVLNGVQSSTFSSPGTAQSNPRMNCIRSPSKIAVTFSNGSANVVATGNTLSANDPVQLNSVGGSLPGNFAVETTYYVKTTGSTITLSATPGGTAILASGAGSGTLYLYPASGSAAFNWVTTVCCTNYVNYSEQSTLAELTAGFQYLQAVSNADTTTQASLAAAYEATNNVGLWAPAGGSTLLAASYVAWLAWANGFGATMKLCNYEGGSSPDYVQNINNAGIIGTGVNTIPSGGITLANPCVVTFASCTVPNGAQSGGSPLTGNPCVIGMPLSFLNLTDTTQLNCQSAQVTFTPSSANITWTAHGLSANDGVTFMGNAGPPQVMPGNIFAGIGYYVKTVVDTNTITVSATKGGTVITVGAVPSHKYSGSKCFKVTNVSGNNISIEVDSTAFTAHSSNNGNLVIGFNSPNSIGGGGAMYVNAIRYGQKFAPNQQSSLVTNYTNVRSAGGEFPSCFTLSDQSVWGVWDPDIYGSPVGTTSTPPQWLGIVQFNN